MWCTILYTAPNGRFTPSAMKLKAASHARIQNVLSRERFNIPRSRSSPSAIQRRHFEPLLAEPLRRLRRDAAVGQRLVVDAPTPFVVVETAQAGGGGGSSATRRRFSAVIARGNCADFQPLDCYKTFYSKVRNHVRSSCGLGRCSPSEFGGSPPATSPASSHFRTLLSLLLCVTRNKNSNRLYIL
jgi:hypothetical protein